MERHPAPDCCKGCPNLRVYRSSFVSYESEVCGAIVSRMNRGNPFPPPYPLFDGPSLPSKVVDQGLAALEWKDNDGENGDCPARVAAKLTPSTP